ncbi:hypothetical protein A3F58_01775 [Candidatus Roizmanbacteria bacterium RIFCSPHIGHO2_12_FULL_37_9b]|uniref:Glycosyl transferase family 1 domain-containing protein n=1 Tax=Candidatus Roizmanbacteria bacterium RIFCSPHIGHO2_02_FULL_38_11 TaxID=1802039 RepID=A0A1F7H2D1_9BACT|nr:MAG: hypothetical protein A3C25_01320 [Candidatus Roizmanbacteria bacterium RIFCSPHIGHO2_02_FULL_38_11]OGK34618.1 MAG: hypothetical protein A3F58_01775 [Candidatus Roizmanbacteria bacterium RIFCSPHIGHO2_12_FULL_37_9b]
MIKVCFIRGKYLNNFEGQNYLFNRKDIQFTAVSSLFPLHRRFPFPVQKLTSPVDLPFFNRGIKYLGNRILGDSHMLFGLDELSNKFDVFHTADPHYYYSYQLAKLRKKNLIKTLIATSWETIPFNNESIGKKKLIKHFSLKHIDYFICHTEKAKKTLIAEGVNGRKIELVRLGVDLTRFKPNFVNNKNITILFVGRLVEEKGILDLYEAYKNIKYQISNLKSLPRWQAGKTKILKLRIVGDGPLRDYLLDHIELDKLIDNVTIEQKDYEEMPKVYEEADIFVLPSKRTNTWEEQYGMVLVEAMASGLPIIAYNTGVIPEIVGSAGVLIKEGDRKNLFTSIKHLINVGEHRDKLGKMGRKRAEKEFDAKKTANKIKDIYIKSLI